MLALSVVLNGSEAVIAGTVCPLNEKKKKELLEMKQEESREKMKRGYVGMKCVGAADFLL